jgi:hypothetical protein
MSRLMLRTISAAQVRLKLSLGGAQQGSSKASPIAGSPAGSDSRDAEEPEAPAPASSGDEYSAGEDGDGDAREREFTPFSLSDKRSLS